MRARFILAGLVLLCMGPALGGCTTGRVPPPAIKAEPVVVKVPVAVPCVNEADVAPEPARVANELNGQAGHDLLVVDRSALELRTWGQGLAAQLKACAKPSQTGQ